MFDSYRPIISQDEQRFYTVGDLEYLTAGALYGGDKPIIKRRVKGFIFQWRLAGDS